MEENSVTDEGCFAAPMWPWQERGLHETIERIAAGSNAIAITGPTGSGKSRLMFELVRWACEQGHRVALYTNRILLTEQIARGLGETGIPFGVRAAGFEEWADPDASVQLCASTTEAARVLRPRENEGKHLSEELQRSRWPLFPSDIDIYDEIHMQCGKVVQQIMAEKEAGGAVRIGFTATPLGISDLFPELPVVAGTNSECREFGSLLPCRCYAPDEPDLRHIKTVANGEYKYGDIMKTVWTPQVFGRVFKYWQILNPEQKPALGFGPGVPESLWFAQQFEAQGINAAHIDGEDVYWEGRFFKSNRTMRDLVLRDWEAGKIKIVWNRWVMKEGLDFPFLKHLITATPIGSLTSFLQCVGRVLRRDYDQPDMKEVIWQDHGGSYHRHGSPNWDRAWEKFYHHKPAMASEYRTEQYKQAKEKPPIPCPQCKSVIRQSRDCPSCGFRLGKFTRQVLQADGRLVETSEAAVKPRRVRKYNNTETKWKQVVWRMRRADKTFRQALGLFVHENYYYPPTDLPLMPIDDTHWWRRIQDVEMRELIGGREWAAKHGEQKQFFKIR